MKLTQPVKDNRTLRPSYTMDYSRFLEQEQCQTYQLYAP
jgi:hypothetical protein